MDKFEEFKSFCKDKEYLKENVRKGKYTWQELYEIYDIYGVEAKEFHEEETEVEEEKTEETKSESNQKKEGISSIIDLISGFDADKIQEGLSGMKKILAVLGEISKPEETELVSRRNTRRPYQRNDD